METRFFELSDCYILISRIAVYLIRFDSPGWEIRKYAIGATYLFFSNDKRPRVLY